MTQVSDTINLIYRARQRQISGFRRQGGTRGNQSGELLRGLRHYIHQIRSARAQLRANAIGAFQRTCADMFLDRRFIRLACVFEIKRRMTKGIPIVIEGVAINGVPNFENVEQLRRICESQQDCRPPTPVAKQNPLSGAYRITYRFDIADCVKQTIAKDIIEGVLGLGDNNFSLPDGGGIHAAAAFIKSKLFTEEFPYWVYLDLEQAFPSISRRHIRSLIPLPESVIENVVAPVLTANADVGPNLSSLIRRHRMPAGNLAQGNICSAAILGALITRETSELQSSDRAEVIFVDDMTFGLPTQQHARSLLAELQERFRALEGGPLAFSRHEIVSPLEGERLEFAGYSFLRSEVGEDICETAQKARDKFQIKVMRMLDGRETTIDENEVLAMHQRWETSFTELTAERWHSRDSRNYIRALARMHNSLYA